MDPYVPAIIQYNPIHLEPPGFYGEIMAPL
jgi:hypothetical protein